MERVAVGEQLVLQAGGQPVAERAGRQPSRSARPDRGPDSGRTRTGLRGSAGWCRAEPSGRAATSVPTTAGRYGDRRFRRRRPCPPAGEVHRAVVRVGNRGGGSVGDRREPARRRSSTRRCHAIAAPVRRRRCRASRGEQAPRSPRPPQRLARRVDRGVRAGRRSPAPSSQAATAARPPRSSDAATDRRHRRPPSTGCPTVPPHTSDQRTRRPACRSESPRDRHPFVAFTSPFEPAAPG